MTYITTTCRLLAFFAAVVSCTANAQTANDLEAKMVSQGQWMMAFRVPSKAFVTSGYDVVFDNNVVIKIGDGTYALNLAKTNIKPTFWDESFQTGTYKIDCTKSELFFIGYKLSDGSWIEGKPGKIWKFSSRSQAFFGEFCARAESIIASRDAAVKAAASPAATTNTTALPSAQPAGTPPGALRQITPKPDPEPAAAAPKPPPLPKSERVYSAGGITITCYTEQGRRICR